MSAAWGLEEALMDCVENDRCALTDGLYVTLMDLCAEHRQLKEELHQAVSLQDHLLDKNDLLLQRLSALEYQNTFLRDTLRRLEGVVSLVTTGDRAPPRILTDRGRWPSRILWRRAPRG